MSYASSLPIVPLRACHPRYEIPQDQASVSYASSENIVEIIVIAEKLSSGFFLITQVTGVF
jgi:hypothetical protein